MIRCGHSNSKDRTLRHFGRHGAATILVLVGLAVATLIFLSILKLIAIQRQSVELQIRQLQASWLAESAIQRACTRLSAETSYRGETWNITAQELGGRDGAKIVVRVEDIAGKPDRRTVHVDADYPDEPDQRARQSREVIVHIPTPKPSDSPSESTGGRSGQKGTEP